jgi:LmbE family N-acetylglucosaminyl deacetylase
VPTRDPAPPPMIVRLLLLLLWLAPAAAAQRAAEPAPRVVMNLAAHPDDEDGLTMAHYRHAHDAVVHSVIYTRGEGGQNEIGPELYAALGAIRTAETEAAARHLGVQVRFLNFDDFGYSKRAAETFERWGGEDAVTARLVYLIRKLKPDVLFTNHDTLTVGARVQHGHHQAVGISAVRAMALAADPSFHPEQLAEEGVDLWQPQRLFLRLWRGGQDTAHVRVPVGDLLPGRDHAAAELAVRAAAEHRSQGFDLIAERFRQDTTYFALLAEAPGVPPLPHRASDLAAGLPPNPHAATQSLAYRIDAGRVPAFPRQALRLSDSLAVPGGEVTLRWPAAVGRGYTLRLSGAVDTTFVASAGEAVLRVPPAARPTLPRERAQYLRFESAPPVQYALLDPEGGVVYAGHLPVEIAPPLVLDVAEAVPLPGGLAPRLLLHRGWNGLTLTGRRYTPDPQSFPLTLEVSESDRSIAVEDLMLPLEGDTWRVTLEFPLPDDLPPGTYSVSARAHLEGGPVVSEYDGVILPEVSVAEGLRVGLVRSYDEATEAALREMGVSVTPLDSLALATGAFEGLHTIVVDIRAYLVRDDLRAHTDRLLAWVREGGHLVVTYHKTMEWNEGVSDPFASGPAEAPAFVPYPLTLGRGRVTDASAEVAHLVPDHPLFLAPNRLTSGDWEGWVQERGLYFPARYDPAYTELLAMADPGEPPQRSSTLLATYGEGTYLYTALGWYRQMGAYVPGAYRAFANLISLPLTDGRGAGTR